MNNEQGLYIVSDNGLIKKDNFDGDISQEITIDLDVKNIQFSRVSLPNEEGLWDFEDCDLDTTRNVLIGNGIECFSNSYALENESIEYLVYKDKGEFIFKLEDSNFNLSFSEFKDHIITTSTWHDTEMTNSEFKQILSEDLKFTEKTMFEIPEQHRSFKMLIMHNDEDRKALSTQVQDLTNGELSFGDFEHRKGYLFNKDNKLLIVLPEKSLEELALFNRVKSQFLLSDVSFQIKNSESEINYLVRENNQLGLVELNNKEYKVYEEKPSAVGDSTTIILLKDNEKLGFKPKELSSDYGIKQGKMKLDGTTLITEFNVRNGEDFTITTDTKNSDVFIVNNQSAFEDAVDSAYFAPEPENRDDVVESNLKDLIKSNFNNEVKKVKQNVKKASSPKPKRLKNT